MDFDGKVGAGLRAEYQFSPILGVELGVLGSSGLDVDIGDLGGAFGVATEIGSFSPVTLGLNYHFAPDIPMDFFAGPFVALVNYGSVELETGSRGVSTGISADNDWAWGGIAGLEIPLRKGRWSIHANLRYIDTKLSSMEREVGLDSDLDPFIVSIGIGYRF